MAYAQQPQYQHQQSSYASPQQASTAAYDNAPADHGAGFDGVNRPGHSQQYPDAYESRGGNPGHGRDIWQEVNGGGYGGNGYHGGRERNGGGIPPGQQPQQRPVEAGRAYSDPRIRGQPRSKFRPLERNRHPEGDLQCQPDLYRVAQGHEQQYQPKLNPRNDLPAQANSDNEYDNPSDSRGNDWETDQEYRSHVDADRQYRKPQPNAGLHGQGYADGHGNQSQDHHAFAPVIPKLDYQEPPRSSHGQPPIHFAKPETVQQSKASSNGIVQKLTSYETVAWDNPFPTFPMRPKKGGHSSSRSPDRSVAEARFKDKHRHESNNDSRPQTASSKDSSYTIPQHHGIDDFMHVPENNDDGYSGREARSRRRADRDATQERLSTRGNGKSSARVEPSKAPTVQSRHSEDNQIRLPIPVDSGLDSSYGRSKTMPTAISEAAVKPSNRPRPPVQTDWQEPGPVAGYYGPEDRGFTPTSPADQPQRRLYGQPKGKSDEKRPYGHAAIQKTAAQTQNQTQNQDGRQLHTPQDSLGDLFDNYYDTPTPQDQQRYAKPARSRHRPHIDEDMPQFNDATPGSGLSHQHGPTLAKHLQFQQRSQEYSPMPVPSQADRFRNPQNDPYAKGRAPRSRSQPDLKDRQSPRQQQGDGFDFGVPGPSVRPPATAPTRGEYDLNAHGPTRIPNHRLRPMDREQLPGVQGYPGMVPTPVYRSGDRIIPSLTEGPPPVAHQLNGGPDRYRSPPQDAGLCDPPPMVYQGCAQPDRYRPPPLQGEQSRHVLAEQPYRPSPKDRNMENGTFPIPHQNKGRSPPLQEGRSRDGQSRSPGGRPPAINSTGATPPATKSPVNPDALPSHPAPVRAGLMEGSPVNQTQKLASFRQYSAVPSPMQLSDPSQKPGSLCPSESKRDSVPVSHQELDRLKQVIARNPNDLAAQLALAKKMVEAASVLVDERADPRTRSKSREKYIMDAYKIVKKLSGNGYTEATFYLADCYTRGALGLESETREAFKLYQNAAKAGHAQAAYRVAVCCEIGQEEGGGTSRDAVKAMQWYKRAATLGDTPAMYKMGIISLKGLLGQPKNPNEAIVWLKRAAERADKENPHALHELALLHQKPSSNDGMTKDEAYSSELFTQAANLGYKFSQYRLGSAYEYGLMGCPVDPRQSIAWYSKAAVQEEHQSELALSGWYLTGSEGILQQSDTEAYLWARKAALAGLAKAEYAMGYFTEVGIGATANLEDAKRWYWKAASQNFPKARDRLGDLRRGGPMKKKERVSRSNMRKSSEGECIVM